ncbi:DUF7139 domain-containing protein [Salinibaculum salinum]|uniref:DUF7139 domain-containing protein n=1 Tax=Salinibaculum salinum TaxID=3131996 RepID=UPI0030EE2CBC
MPSLDEAYDRDRFTERDPRRVAGGLCLGAAGALAVLAAIILVAVAGDTTLAKAQSGVLAGLGVPAMFLAVVLVLPASTRTRLGVVAGSVLSVAGVWLFWQAYPMRWTRTADSMAFETVMVYGLGGAVALWFVFSAVASFRRRNNPQGTVELEVVRQGETKTVEVSRDRYRRIVSDGGDASDVIRELEE